MMWCDDRAGVRMNGLSGKLIKSNDILSFHSHFAFPLTDYRSTVLTPMQQSNSQHNLNFIFSSPMSSFVHPQPTAFPPTQPDDPNSPVLFKHNINLVQTQISTIRSFAHEALNAMYVLHSPHGSISESSPAFSSFPQLIEKIRVTIQQRRLPTRVEPRTCSW